MKAQQRKKIFLDGEFVDEADAKVSVFDHGLLYGDGVFEGIRVYGGRVFRLEEHLERLFDSAKAIRLSIPLSLDDLVKTVLECCRQNSLWDGYIRLVVTRGKGDLGLNPASCPKPTLFIIADAIRLYPASVYERGLRLHTAAVRRVSSDALEPAVKSLNYLNNILAKMEAAVSGADESLLLNEQGYVAECTGDNVFAFKHGELVTPPVSAGVLPGITRREILRLAREEGVDAVERNMTRYDLFVADEVFLTGTAAEIVPVVEIDGRTVGTGKPGALTQRLLLRFRALTRTTGPLIYSTGKPAPMETAQQQ
ncbi:branched-chain amino acid aminotransferase [Methylacidimicrobium cyclopophantes]|uniref:Branched-chain-amino-acid aminotransferase n=1 Tax=Methylacidimicrobium cyclopophantes TaxID=1041766 RepID=A0A5E6M745_9BACT|nr:branched-chain-amino-acid transaminase [Methylacidimicrobium cyclopophantes]VVM05040.1 branched-chain amino acid aminotransferase [Methylacidimicrobium cyclopophantes]